MQSFNQGTGSPGFPTWVGTNYSYARYKNPASIRLYKQNPLRPKNIVKLESEYIKNYNLALGRSSVNKSVDSGKPTRNVTFAPSQYGRGRGIKNTDYGIVQIAKNGDIPRDWKSGSQMRTSSDHRINYLEENAPLFPKIRQEHPHELSVGRINDYRTISNSLNAPNRRLSHSVSPTNSMKVIKSHKGHFSHHLNSPKSLEKIKTPLKAADTRVRIGHDSHKPEFTKPDYGTLRSPVQFRNMIAEPIEDHQYNPYLRSHFKSPSY
uniref:Uncharacterized protein n=1 Tax=Euplotes crassus TaxID=5936 RepID=A0A7S3KGC0_EUPCR